MSNEADCRTAPATRGLLKIPQICVLSLQYYFKVRSGGFPICGSLRYSWIWIPSNVFGFFLITFTVVINIDTLNTVTIVNSASTICTVITVPTIVFTWKSHMCKGIPTYTTVTFDTKVILKCQLIICYSYKGHLLVGMEKVLIVKTL